MRSLVNEKVKHIRYGNGVVEAEEVKKIFVKFKDLEEVKAFPFPCSFEHFLMLEDEELQEEYHALAVEKRMEKEKEDEAKIEEFLQKDIERRQAERATKRRTVKKKA